jgi:hypothetical protein
MVIFVMAKFHIRDSSISLIIVLKTKTIENFSL